MNDTRVSILILEDNPGDALLLRTQLRDGMPHGLFVEHVETIAEAREALAMCRFDVVISDLDVPDGKGLETTRAIVESSRDAAVVVMTGNSDPTLGLASLKLGAQDFLQKDSFDQTYVAKTILFAIERQRSRNELATAHQELQQLTRDIEEYTHSVAHDLKAPLFTIAGHSGFAIQANSTGDREAVDRSMQIIRSTTTQASKSIEGLLRLMKVGQVEFATRIVGLQSVIDDVILEFEPRAVEAGAVIERVGSIPAVIGDEIWLRRVIENLLSNAIQYGCTSKEPSIQVGSVNDGDFVELFVSDNGAGIPAKEVPNVFQPHTRLSTSKGTAGSGIGLSICRRIIEAHGGRIWIEDGSSQGTTFCFRLLSANADREVFDRIAGDGARIAESA